MDINNSNNNNNNNNLNNNNNNKYIDLLQNYWNTVLSKEIKKSFHDTVPDTIKE